MAAQKGHSDVVNILLKRQEEIVFPELMTCAMGGKADQLYCLLEEGDCINSKRGADVKKRHLPTGSTVLHIAAKMGHLDVLEYLLAFCKSSRGWHGYIRMVKTLLANGATTALLDKNGFLFSLPEFGGMEWLAMPKKQSFAGVMSPSIPDSGPNLNPPSTQEASSINFEKFSDNYNI
ncbi:hypothetical protein KUTeg_001983 [Tegillarca granosa]|uniref:Uncharacterized protein n=1 Tax=Tegillarca granosa TaxID=220873 RepID=A0ABQ9FW65_TEGGR|nr:hypothetical protein KUTeg_001983 [Tegillarca granosa]